MSRKTLISNYTVENKGPYNNGDYAPFSAVGGLSYNFMKIMNLICSL